MTREQLKQCFDTLGEMFSYVHDNGGMDEEDLPGIAEGMRQVERIVFRLGYAPLD